MTGGVDITFREEHSNADLEAVDRFKRNLVLDFASLDDLITTHRNLSSANSKLQRTKKKLRKSVLSTKKEASLLKSKIKNAEVEFSQAESDRKRTENLHSFINKLETLQESLPQKKSDKMVCRELVNCFVDVL
jgi:multidrug resistance efflux pump